MPGPNAPDTQRHYRALNKLIHVHEGTVDHPAHDPDLAHAAELGHVEHDGERWQVTPHGAALVQQVRG